ncbi:conserved hypothetical protein [delta proteobacterium NaphS2]|nr:conserved hypothetical protein [delta proteobacterium NaphS2]
MCEHIILFFLRCKIFCQLFANKHPETKKALTAYFHKCL